MTYALIIRSLEDGYEYRIGEARTMLDVLTMIHELPKHVPSNQDLVDQVMGNVKKEEGS